MNFAQVYDKFMEYVNYKEWYEYIKKELNKMDVKLEKIVEIGCGTGEFLYLFKNDGYDIMGIDLSEDMLCIAKEKLDKYKINDVKLIKQDMLKLDTGRENDLILAFFDTVNYLKNLKEFSLLLEKASENLKEGGIFLFDIATRELMEDMFRDGIFYDDREDMTIIWEHNYNKKTKLDEIGITFFVMQRDGKYERVDDYYEKKIFSEIELKKIIENSKFKIKKTIKNNKFAGARVFYILEKKQG